MRMTVSRRIHKEKHEAAFAPSSETAHYNKPITEMSIYFHRAYETSNKSK